MTATLVSPLGAPGAAPRGQEILDNPLLNKDGAFTERERDAFGLRGVLPARVETLEEQEATALAGLRKIGDGLAKYSFLAEIQQRNETLFYRLLVRHTAEIMPIVYTPTVGRACQEYGSVHRRARGLYVSYEDRGRVREVLENRPNRRGARLVVVTDGQRILGLGDLGVFGMGIPVGKLALYSACAGVHPSYCLPVTLDVGTDTESLLADPSYFGLKRPRVTGADYDAFVKEFMDAVAEEMPGCLVQFEDFGNANAFRLLHDWRHKALSFNDDIQGTAAVAVAGLLSALRVTGGKAREQRILFLGAGEAGTGIGELWTAALAAEGMPEAEARETCWYVDSKGLVTADRADLNAHKRQFAHVHAPVATFAEAVAALRPTAIVGVAGQGGAFTADILAKMAEFNARPIVFALSNPTSKAECAAQEAYDHTGGRCVFASGSPFPPVLHGGKEWLTGQGNNVYVFPGIGLGALAVGAREVTDSMFLAAAKALAGLVTEADLEKGRVYPELSGIREVSAKIAEAVAEEAYRLGLASLDRPADLGAALRGSMYVPEYRDLA